MKLQWLINFVLKRLTELSEILSTNDSSKADLPFEDKVVVLGGDFKQILPVVEGGGKNDIIGSSLVMSPLWKHVKVLKLHTNMCLSSPGLSTDLREELGQFAQWAQDIGNGTIGIESGTAGSSSTREISSHSICIPDDILLSPPSENIAAATDYVYDSFFFSYSDPTYLAQRAIVCPTNSVVDDINDALYKRVPGSSNIFLSYDSISKSTDHVGNADILFPPELLHSISINNFPEHEIGLKISIPVMLLRNMNQSLGLCNGTRLLITKLGERVFEREVITGSNKG